jgi:hypothetical protein
MQVWKEQRRSLSLEFLHCAKLATGILAPPIGRLHMRGADE